MIFLWNWEYRDNSPVWEGLSKKFEQRLLEESGHFFFFFNKQADSSIQPTKDLKFFMKSVWPTLTDFSILDSTCPFTVPNDDSITEVTHVITSLVLSFTAWHLYWSGCRLVALKKTRKGWGRSIWFKEIWISYSDIKRSEIFPRFLFLIPESRWAVQRF